MKLDVVSVSQTFGIIVLSWHMMRTWEETRTESELSNRKSSGESDAMIADTLHCHVMI